VPEVVPCPSGGSFSFLRRMDKVLGPLLYYRGAEFSSFLDLGDPVVPWCIRVFPVKFSEFFQTTCRKVVEWLFHPVSLVRIVEPFHEIHDLASSFGAAYDLVDVVFLALLDIVCFPKHL